MQHDVEVGLIERILGNLAAGRREMSNGEQRSPVETYISPQRHEAELSRLFRRHPVIIGPSSALPEPGSFLTRDLTGAPILAVRDAAGQVRAFLNVCRHRGSRIVAETSGRAGRSFVCPYHAWTYDLSGALVGVSDTASFAGIDRASHGLVRLPAAERHGLIWVRPSPSDDGGDALDIDEFLGPLAADFAAFKLEGAALYAPVELRRAMNWKVMVDTFLEDYHFRWVHGQSVHRFYLDNASIYDRFGRHIRYVIPKRTLKDLAGTDPATWRLRDHSNILYYIFPNTVMVFVADHAAIFAMFPDGPQRSVMHLSFCLPERPESEKAKNYWDRNARLIRTALDEDFAIGEGIQAGFASGANKHLTFGRYEKGLAFFHDIVEEALTGA